MMIYTPIASALSEKAIGGRARVEAAREFAIDALAACGYAETSLDEVQDPITAAQMLLEELMLRVPLVAKRILRSGDQSLFASLPMRAFNILEGMVFLRDGDVPWIVMEHRLFHDSESVLIIARQGNIEDLVTAPFTFHFNESVDIIGAVQNVRDATDNDWGTPIG